MLKKPVLVVMAAGMGSRYGGLKQIDPVGSCGEAILDYSLYDAWAAGFETAVIIIKSSIREIFMETVGKRLERCPMEIRYAWQELEDLPEGYTPPAGRAKPWGTCHAVLCAKEAIGGAPFAVINADDYYGKSSFISVFNALSAISNDRKYDYFIVGYRLRNTVTDSGAVTRGVCRTENGYLTAIDERKRIEKRGDGIAYTEDGAHWTPLHPESTVSMNFWGFTPSVLEEIEAKFPKFLAANWKTDPEKCEFYLPMLISELLNEGKARVQVLETTDNWYGVTYAADRPLVTAAIQNLTAQGLYPQGLWK